MSLLKNLKTDSSIAGEKDQLGGGGVFDSGYYNFIVTMAYLQESSGGALGLFLTLKDKASGRELRNTQYLTGGRDKGQKNYYEKDGEKNYLPGFLIGNSLAMLTTGKEISDLDTEEKVVSIYNFDAKADVPTKVPVLVDLLGKEINAGVLRVTEDKTKKNEADGKYYPTGETRDVNELDKFFCAREGYEHFTTAEIKAKAEKPEFYAAWTEKNAGKTRVKAGKQSGTAGAPAKSGAPAGGGKPASSLFG
jgi:hypothetical protein